jgi:hypothetical protein
MLAIQAGDSTEAIEYLESLIATKSTAFRPRLMLAYLTDNLQLAARCAMENPGSLEALAVLVELGYTPARDALLSLTSDGTGNYQACRRFLDEVKSGVWKHGRRYEHVPPSLKGTYDFPERLKQ